MRPLFVTMVFALLGFALLGFASLSFAFSVPLSIVPPHFEVHGHRGARAKRPENSLQAFDYAIKAGVTAIELDLGVTKDLKVVINHDTSVNIKLCETTHPQWKDAQRILLKDITLKDLKSFDCGKKINPKFPQQVLTGEKVELLSFRDFLAFLNTHKDPRAKSVHINIETKIDIEKPEESVDFKSFVDLILKDLSDLNFPMERVILQSFDFRSIRYSKSKWPALRTAALVSDGPKVFQSEEIFARDILHQTGADYLSPSGKIASRDIVNATHKLKRKILVWTINEADQWRYFVKLGVDGIITDDPELLIKDLFP